MKEEKIGDDALIEAVQEISDGASQDEGEGDLHATLPFSGFGVEDKEDDHRHQTDDEKESISELRVPISQEAEGRAGILPVDDLEITRKDGSFASQRHPGDDPELGELIGEDHERRNEKDGEIFFH
jgi:hypothetical protein